MDVCIFLEQDGYFSNKYFLVKIYYIKVEQKSTLKDVSISVRPNGKISRV